METGKLPSHVLTRLLSRTATAPDVLIGPAYGEDAAAVRFGGRILVATSDPITFATDRIGSYAVTVNANDIAVLGAQPRYFLATILLPPVSTERDAENVFDQIKQECDRVGVILIGGHTEITPTVERAVVCGAMLGETEEGSLVRTSGARVGDAVVLIGTIAIEGTAILGREAAAELASRGVSESTIESAKALLDEPGICVLDYARAAMRVGGVTSMHDPTEGGLATALRELAAASGHGIVVERTRIPVLDECSRVCSALGLDPLGLIASGSLLVIMPADKAARLVAACAETGITADAIGEITPADEGIRFCDGSPLPLFERDEIARFFERSR